MPVVVGISLRTAGKLYSFDPEGQRYYIGERVLVETVRGQELGTVKLPPHEDAAEDIVPPLKPIIRRATALDVGRDAANREREERALIACKRLVEKLALPMNLIDAQYTLDCSHLLIHFLAENRVDFRELVRELAHELHTRIELRQVGVRDEANLIGGYGICGRKLCCSAFLGDFTPVSISMAKDQGLALNPQKISGTCGRLMCCLAFECDQYREERAGLPRLNAMVETPAGVGKVTKLNVMSRMIEVLLPDTPAPVWYSADELAGKTVAKTCCGGGTCATPCGSVFPEFPAEESDALATLLDPPAMVAPGPMMAPPPTRKVSSPAMRNEAPPAKRNEAPPANQPPAARHRRQKAPAGRPPATPGQSAGKAPAKPPVQQQRVPGDPNAPQPPANRKPRHKPQGAKPSAPQPNPAPPVPVKVGAPEPAANVPSARYHPRRRRRVKGEE